jgi:leucyl aminopeptidase
MGFMKGDMSGGGVVFAVTLALARARAKVNLLTIIPAVENMPSGSASRPGDVVTAMNGKTIEIISTDAEGRMTLADSLCYAEKMKAQTVIDIATLTGGCVVALGDVAAAVMGKDQRLIDELIAISERTGERFWQLPLFEEYKKQIKSDIADLKNSGGRKASAITAGLFLQSFVDKARWIHIDIAGKEIVENSSFYTPKGGTGFGVRTLFEFVRQAGA